MQISVEDVSGVQIVTVNEDRIDAANAVQFKDVLGRPPATGANRIILDLAAVEFIDSSGLGAVVAVMKALAPDTAVELVSLNDTVAKVFRLTRMDSIFTIHPERSAALAEVRHAS